jgi:tetratricopeptide (TPR) repeat protein
MTDITEGLPENIQRLIQPSLAKGEELVVSLPGGMGEALAATTKKLFLAAETHDLGKPAREQVREFALSNLEDVRIEDTSAGGSVVVSVKGGTDPGPSISFPAYKREEFEAAVNKIRELAAAAPTELEEAQAQAQTIRCPACGVPVEPRFLFCPGCGVQLHSLCRNCSAPIDESWSFCTVCGRRLDRSRLGPSAPSQAKQAAQAEAEGTQEKKERLEAAEQEVAESLNDQGTQCYEDGRIEEAVSYFKRAIELEPGVAKYHVNLGVAYGELEGSKSEALASYRKAAELDPQDPSPHLLMGYLFNEGGDPDSARREWETVVKLAPNTAESKEAQDAIANLNVL